MRLIDLIDADKLKTELDAWARIIRKPNCYSRGDALHIIDTAPEVKAVPVVRCRECEYYNITCCSSGTGWCENMDMGVSDDFYCANGAKSLNCGERQDGEPQHMTNADRIRSMTDEELARFLGDEPPYFSTYDKYLEWLKQPAKEEQHETD